MKIELFSLEYPPQIGGIADYYYNLVINWPKANEISVFNTKTDENFKKSNFYHWPRLSYLLKKRLKEKQIDYLLVGHILPLGAITYLTNLYYNIPYSVILHGLDFSLAIKNYRKEKLSFEILKKADKIICANSYLAQEIINWQSKFKDKIVIINPAATVKKADQKIINLLKSKYKLNGKKIIFSLGRLVPRKGFDQTISALAILKLQNPDLVNNTIYLIAGDGPDKDRLKKIVKDTSLEKNVIFLGKISETEKYACYSLANIFSMPTRKIGPDYEGFGIVYLEANLFKKPVIASLAGGTFDAVKDQINGLVIKENNTIDLSLAIKTLLVNDDLSKELGIKGCKRAKEDFNWQNQAKKLRANLNIK